MGIVEELTAIQEPMERLRRSGAALTELQATTEQIGEIRREAVDELRGQGQTLSQIAKEIGVSPARLSQMSTLRRKPERVVLTPGSSVTIAVPVESTNGSEGLKRPVIFQQDAEFINIVETLAASLGLSTTVEYIAREDFIDLNRDGVIVTCGPRQSPWLEQILASDESYTFERDANGWYLRDKTTGKKHRSPEDDNVPADYGYLGTFASPDGKGHWLFAAGIHALGSQAAAQYLADNLEEIHHHTKGNLWSALVKGEYDPTTNKLTTAELLAPIKRRGRTKPRQ